MNTAHPEWLAAQRVKYGAIRGMVAVSTVIWSLHHHQVGASLVRRSSHLPRDTGVARTPLTCSCEAVEAAGVDQGKPKGLDRRGCFMKDPPKQGFCSMGERVLQHASGFWNRPRADTPCARVSKCTLTVSQNFWEAEKYVLFYHHACE